MSEGVLSMKEYRCPYPHPTRSGHCNALFFRGAFDGEIEVKCWRCHRSVVFDSREDYTASLDKALVTV